MISSQMPTGTSSEKSEKFPTRKFNALTALPFFNMYFLSSGGALLKSSLPVHLGASMNSSDARRLPCKFIIFWIRQTHTAEVWRNKKELIIGMSIRTYAAHKKIEVQVPGNLIKSCQHSRTTTVLRYCDLAAERILEI